MLDLFNLFEINNEEKINYMLDFEAKLFNKATKIAERISKTNPKWQTDIRYTTYNTFSSMIRSARLILIFNQQCLNNSNWWNSHWNNHFFYLDDYFGISENYREEKGLKTVELFLMILYNS